MRKNISEPCGASDLKWHDKLYDFFKLSKVLIYDGGGIIGV